MKKILLAFSLLFTSCNQNTQKEVKVAQEENIAQPKETKKVETKPNIEVKRINYIKQNRESAERRKKEQEKSTYDYTKDYHWLKLDEYVKTIQYCNTLTKQQKLELKLNIGIIRGRIARAYNEKNNLKLGEVKSAAQKVIDILKDLPCLE